MGGKRKAKPPVVATCHLCAQWFHSTLLKNDQVHNPRKCQIENREILSTDPICENFELAKYFYCDRTDHQVTIQMCHARQNREMDECRRCKQREQLAVAEALVGVVHPVSNRGPLKVRTVSGMEDEIDKPIEGSPRPILKKRANVTIWEKPEWNN